MHSLPLPAVLAAVGLVLNVTIACWEITSVFFSNVNLILSQNFEQNFVLISKNRLYFSRHQTRSSADADKHARRI